MGTAAVFSQMLHGELGAYGAWFPVANTFKLGDYGLISDGIFMPIGNIAEYGLAFDAAAGPPATLDFSSEGTNIVRFAGGAEVTALPDAPIDAKISIEFSNASSIMVKAGAITVSQMQNVNEVSQALARTVAWERRFRVVWGTYTADRCAVVTTRGENAKFVVSGKADALKLFELGKVGAGVTVSQEQDLGFKSVGKTGVLGLRLFKLKWIGDGPKLLGSEDRVEVESEGPASLEDDV